MCARICVNTIEVPVYIRCHQIWYAGRSSKLQVNFESIAYNSLCKDLKYILNTPYIILNYPNVVGFLIFESLFLVRSKIMPYVTKNITKVNGICIW